MVSLGGFAASSGVIMWSFLAPLGALVWDRRRAWAWYVGFVVLLAAAIPLGPLVRPEAADMPEAVVHAFGALNLGGVSLVAFTLLATFARQREAALRTSPEAASDHPPRRDRASPAARAGDDRRRLRRGEHPLRGRRRLHAALEPPRRTGDRRAPRSAVTAFDDLADRYEVEKIKTIGDCYDRYMVAAGVPRPRDDHAHALVRMALEMNVCAQDCLPTDGRGNLRLRMGIASGPVVAGVIGRRRFLTTSGATR